MRIDVLTLFPEMFQGVLGASILKRAAEPVADPAHPDDPAKVRPPAVSYHLTDIRDYTQNKHQKVDQPPFGGGPGMVIQCQPVWDAVQAVEAQSELPATRIMMSPQGQPLTQAKVQQLAAKPRLLLIAGHYEGFDERVIDQMREQGGLEEISLGDYVLSGGELPAMVLIDAVVRLLPGVLGHSESAHYESFSPGQEGLLDHPHYTRPRDWQGRAVPEVLLSGDHKKIEAWRREQAQRRTLARRPDLLGGGQAGDKGISPVIVIRDERKADAEAVDAVLAAAFPTRAEADLVAKLRKSRQAVIALVAAQVGQIVGQVTLSPVRIEDQASIRGLLGLAPVAVGPSHQQQGIGSALIREAIARAKQAGASAIFVLGDPAYYSRFGFEPASNHGFTSIYDAGDAFQVLQLQTLDEHVQGPIRYAPAFDDLE